MGSDVKHVAGISKLKSTESKCVVCETLHFSFKYCWHSRWVLCMRLFGIVACGNFLTFQRTKKFHKKNCMLSQSVCVLTRGLKRRRGGGGGSSNRILNRLHFNDTAFYSAKHKDVEMATGAPFSLAHSQAGSHYRNVLTLAEKVKVIAAVDSGKSNRIVAAEFQCGKTQIAVRVTPCCTGLEMWVLKW